MGSMEISPLHNDEIPVDDATVAALIGEQCPQWAGLPLRRLDAAGTDNTIVRLGDELTVRLPRRGDPEELRARLGEEARALALLAGHCPVPTPRPVALGRPSERFPLPWSVQTWVPGRTATGGSGSVALARDLAGLVLALRRVDTGGRTFGGDGRGGDLRRHDAWMETCLANSEGLLDVPRLRRLWAGFRDLPREGPDVMSHGDLIPGNLLVSGERLAGVLDGGGFRPADPALDLIVGWHLLDDGPRDVFREAVGADDLTWKRSQAWAFEQSMGLIWYYAQTSPPMSRLGRRTLDRLVSAVPR